MFGKSGNFMSLIFCGMFISLTADTARAGAAAIPACKQINKQSNIHKVYYYTPFLSFLANDYFMIFIVFHTNH